MTQRQFISFPKSGRSWVRYALHEAGVGDRIVFHHDGFEYNDGAKPPLDFDFDNRLLRYRDNSLIVYMERNPMDVMVSLYHQVRGRFADFFEYNGTISEFIRDPYFGAQNLKEFRRQWAKICEEKRALRITYEACHADFAGTLGTILEHYDFCVPRENVAAAADAASFEKMREVEDSEAVEYPWLRRRNGFPKLRRGKISAYGAELSEEDVSYLRSIFGA